MSNVFTNLLYHVVFSTKDREPFIAVEAQPLLFAYMGGVLRSERCVAIAIGGVEDHVHLLVKVPPSRPVSEIVGRVKGSSSRWIEQQPWFEGGFAWQRGFSAFSVSQSLVHRVKRYIRKQREQHENGSYADELLTILRLHEIELPPDREARG
jgi:REP element-mobilizing transposase RayT